jgi:amidophosphoribosyltransferase
MIRDIQPGEIIALSRADRTDQANPSTSCTCLFEYVYFSRPDTLLDGLSVDQTRLQAGRALAAEQPSPASVVVGVPDSGLSAALGYAHAANIPYVHGILKNRYASRSLIQPTAILRNLSVAMKFSALKRTVQDQDVALIDDSLIRGTTIRHLVRLLKLAGARSVHLRIASPPVLYPCFYGIETPSQHELPASQMDLADLTAWIGADSVGYLSLDGLLGAIGLVQACVSCFDGSFPASLPDDQAASIRQIPERVLKDRTGSQQAGEADHA